MKENRKAPEIRFPEYTDDWEQRKLGELGEISTGSTPSTSNSAYYSEDGIPWVTPTDINTLTISDTPRKLSEEGAKVGRVVPANTILCTCIASIGKNTLLTVKGSFNQQINSLTPYDENDAYFLLTESEIWSNIMKRMAASGTMQIVNKTEFSELKTMVPSLAEQQQIGTYFRNLDNLITLHQRKCDKIKELKSCMLQKMFPKKGDTKPEIRFPEFTDDWEQRKLSDEFKNFIVPMRDKPKEFGGNIPWTRIEDIEGKYLNDSLSGQYVTEETINQMNLKIIPKDSLIVSSSATFGVVAVITQDLITNQTFIGLVPNDKETLDYWYAFFHSDEARKYMRLQSAGSTIFYIARESFENMPIKVPTKDEMIKIGTYFDNLDNLITLHQRKCDELKELKKGMLQKMFV